MGSCHGVLILEENVMALMAHVIFRMPECLALSYVSVAQCRLHGLTTSQLWLMYVR